MAIDTRIKGFVPGGEDRTHWIFDGEDWTQEEQRVLIDMVTAHVTFTREHYKFDVTNYFEFHKTKFGMRESTIEYLYFCTRYNWRFNFMGETVEQLREKVVEYLNRYERRYQIK